MKTNQSAGPAIRSRPDGCIDLDAYRVRATARRAQAMRDAANLRPAGVGILTMAGMLAIVLLAAAASVRAPNDHAATAHLDAAPIR